MDVSTSDESTRLNTPDIAATSIPGIELLRELGRGGMAVVFEACDLGFRPPRRVAVKLMSTELSADPEFRGRFEREASLVGEFRHDNIVHIFACGETSGAKYIVMEYLPGGTLAERLRKGPLPTSQALEMGRQLASALAYAHERDVIHRDVKPANVLFTLDDKAVLSDFGVAKLVTLSASNLTRHAMVIGSTRYMSPEQERAEAVTDRADVYAFGLMFFEMLTGRAPPPGERVLRRAAEGAQIRESLASTRQIAELVCRCLLIDPAQRPSAIELKGTLTELAASTYRVRPAHSSRRALASWGAIAVCVAAGLAIWFARPRHSSQPIRDSPIVVAPAAQPSSVATPPIPSEHQNTSSLAAPGGPDAEATQVLKDAGANAPIRSGTPPQTHADQAPISTDVGRIANGAAQLSSRDAGKKVRLIAPSPVAMPNQTSGLTAQEWLQKGKDAANEDEKVHAFTEAIGLNPKDSESYRQRGVALRTSDPDAAMRDFNEALRLKPDDARAHSDRGTMLEKKNDLDGAMQEFNTAVRMEPGLAMAYVNRSTGLNRKGDFDAALRDLDMAVRLDPNDATAHRDRGLALRRNGDSAGALAEFDTAIRLKPDNAISYYNRAQVLDEKKDPRNAMANLDQAIRLQPDLAQAYSYRGILKIEARDFRGAVSDLDEAIRFAPNESVAYSNRGVAYLRLGDLARSVSDLSEAIRLKPNEATYYNDRGAAMEKQGNIQRAFDDYNAAIRLKPDYPVVYYRRASLYAKTQDYRSAIVDLQKYLDLGGAEPEAPADKVRSYIEKFKGMMRSKQ